MKISWIKLNFKSKNGKVTPLCKIGNSKEDEIFYRCDRVLAFMESMEPGTEIDEQSFKFEKVKEGKFENLYITFIKPATQQLPKASAHKTPSGSAKKDFDADLSRKQTCYNVAGQVIRSLTGQLEPDTVMEKLKEFYEKGLEILK